jgi:hypothetical protein
METLFVVTNPLDTKEASNASMVTKTEGISTEQTGVTDMQRGNLWKLKKKKVKEKERTCGI